MEEEKLFALAFVLNETGEYVLLTRPTVPDHLFGDKLTGIGGKVIGDERPIDTVRRELKEKANIELTPEDRIDSTVCMRFYNDTEIFIFYIVKNDAELFFDDVQIPDGVLSWYSIDNRELLIACNPDQGDHTNMAYFLTISRIRYASQMV